MLYELFSWFTRTESSLSFSNQNINQDVLKSTQQLALRRRNSLAFEVSEKRRGMLAEFDADGDLAQLVRHHTAYMNFLEFCTRELIEIKNSNLYILGIRYLLTLAPTEEAPLVNTASKIALLFLELLKENKDAALAFFQKNRTQLKQIQAVSVILSAENTKDHLAELRSQLCTQEKALSISPLFIEFIDDPERFAAAILWLLQRDCSVQQILKTNLLQTFMSYHISYLHAKDSPIFHLYQVLALFPCSHNLIKAAEKIQCQVRGFESFSILGNLPATTVHHLEVTKLALDFTSTNENFKVLYQLFGSTFIYEALIWHARCDQAEWGIQLSNVLNKDYSFLQVSALLNRVAVDCSSEILEVLSTLLDDVTVETLLTRHQGAVMHLLPYKPDLQARLSELNVSNYVARLISQGTYAFDLILQLRSMFLTFEKINVPIASLIYSAMIDLMILHPALLDDTELKRLMKQFTNKESVCAEKCRSLDDEFDNCVALQALEPTLTLDSYHLIEDVWVSVARKLSLVKKIASVPTHCPKHKYAMQVYVATVFFSKNPNNFSLDGFIEALGLTPQFASEGVNEYERILIELLIAIDDKSLRAAVIAIFEKEAARRSNWIQQSYGDETIFNRALEQGNLGLVKWLVTKTNEWDVKKAVTLAAHANQWKIVNYFCGSAIYRPDPQTLKDLLIQAASAGQLRTVRLLCEYSIKRLKGEFIKAPFTEAANNGHLDVLQYLRDLGKTEPCVSVMVKALKVAIKSERLEVIAFIGNVPDNSQLSKAVDEALILEQVHDRFSVIQQLCNLQHNGPSDASISEALKRAIKYCHPRTAHFLLNLPGRVINQKTKEAALSLAVESGDGDLMSSLCCQQNFTPGCVVIERALLQAVSLKHFNCAVLLCSLPINKPRLQTIELALQAVAKIGDAGFMDYLCRMSPQLPRQSAIEQALQTAAKLGHLPCVSYLANRVSKDALTQAWQLGAQHGQLSVVEYCCALHRPSRDAIKYALHRKLTRSHEEVVAFLHSMLERPAISRKFVSLKLDVSPNDEPLVESLRSPHSPVASPTLRRVVSSRHMAGLGRHSKLIQQEKIQLQKAAPIGSQKDPVQYLDFNCSLRKTRSYDSLSYEGLNHWGLFNSQSSGRQSVETKASAFSSPRVE